MHLVAGNPIFTSSGRVMTVICPRGHSGSGVGVGAGSSQPNTVSDMVVPGTVTLLPVRRDNPGIHAGSDGCRVGVGVGVAVEVPVGAPVGVGVGVAVPPGQVSVESTLEPVGCPHSSCV